MDFSEELFNQIKEGIINLDPVNWIENNLYLDGKPFKINGNGYKPFADIYRYIGIKALERDSKPIIIVKGRQVGATTMAAALECFFMASGCFGSGDRPPIRVVHCFPFLELAASYSKAKLSSMISGAKPVGKPVKGGKTKSVVEDRIDRTASSNDSLHFKQFLGGNQLWVESTGLDGNRLMGKQLSLETELPTPRGFVKLKHLKEGDELFDEKGDVCRIVKLFPIQVSPESYRITFDDGTTVDACADHLWLTYTKKDRVKLSKFKKGKIDSAPTPTVKNTKEILSTLKIGNRNNHSLPLCMRLRDPNNSKTDKHTFIKNITPIESVPMRCLQVDSPSHLFLITKSYIPTHNTAEVFLADEAQKMRKNAIANSTKILSQARYGKRTKGVQVYFGTPLQSGSHYWETWNNSSQQYYHLGCKKCNEYFPLFTGNDDWESIWLYEYIVKCTKCGFEQDKLEAAENGKWIALNKDPDPEFVGFHINQLYNPMYTKEDILKEKPENSSVNTERAYRNEVLGMFYSGSSGPITPEEIYDKCADFGRKFARSISINDNVKVYGGFDWGDLIDVEDGVPREGGESKGGQSYSCGVILSTTDIPGTLAIQFATLLKSKDPTYKKEVVDQMFRQYNVALAVGDIGHANDLTYTLQKEYGDRFLGSRVHSSVKNHIRFEDSVYPKEIQFEKDYLIKELYDLMKEGKIRFPYGSYEQIGWLINHCCSMELKATLDRHGEIKLRYVKGTSPNDGFMALLNAYIAYKFDISRGFNENNPNRLQVNPANDGKILACLAYMPMRR